MTDPAPTRVNYFTGQFLDADDFRDEQDYHRGRHGRLSRLAVGSGVLCGLEVIATGDGQVVVEPGIAIDPLGREIVLVAPHVVADPFQPTDEDGQPRGERVGDGIVTLLLCYAEGGDEPPDRTVEGYRVVVREGEPPLDPGLSSAQAAVFLPATPRRGFDRRVALYEALDRSCRPPDEVGVVLASVTRSKRGSAVIVDQGGRRRDIYSVAQLLDLILALADRLTAVEGALASARGKGGA